MRECSAPTTCHMSRVMCHMSCVTCNNFLSVEGLLSTRPTPSSFLFISLVKRKCFFLKMYLHYSTRSLEIRSRKIYVKWITAQKRTFLMEAPLLMGKMCSLNEKEPKHPGRKGVNWNCYQHASNLEFLWLSIVKVFDAPITDTKAEQFRFDFLQRHNGI